MQCETCKRPMCWAKNSITKPPGTVVARNKLMCGACYNRKYNGAKKRESWITKACDDCGRTMRAHKTRAADYPGIPVQGTATACINCYKKAVKAKEAEAALSPAAMQAAEEIRRGRERRKAEMERIERFERTHIVTRRGIVKAA